MLQGYASAVNADFYGFYSDDELFTIFAKIVICENPRESKVQIDRHTQIIFHFIQYKLSEETGSDIDQIQAHVQDNDSSTSYAKITLLPSKEYENLWQLLEFDRDLKDHLLHYMGSCYRMLHIGVDPQIIPINRSLLLYGPPGTGKTSLCKALAHKLSCRAKYFFPNIQECSIELVEINCLSLLSKWFSESGKLIVNVFEKIRLRASQKDKMLLVLLDEVESICISRKVSLGGNEPSDAVRAVNALLTQLDLIKAYENIYLLSTSNLLEVLDQAYIDRIDYIVHVPNPKDQAKYNIVALAIRELIRNGLVLHTNVPEFDSALLKLQGKVSDSIGDEILRVVTMCSQLSCRKLKSLLFQAYVKTTLQSEMPAIHAEELISCLSSLLV